MRRSSRCVATTNTFCGGARTPRMPTNVWLGDLLVEVHLTGADTDGRFCLLVDHPRPGWSLPPHHHASESETIYVIEGSFEVDVDGHTHELGPGELVHVPSGVKHSGRCVGQAPGKRVLVFSPAGVENFFLAAGSPERDADADPGRIAELAKRFGYRFGGA